MIAQRCFAMILKEEVRNVFICDDYEMANYLSRATYGDDALAVECTQCPCQIGSKYINQIFYDENNSIIPFYPTTEQEVEILKDENTNLQLALTKQYETNLALQGEVCNTQLALTEIYEELEV